MKTKMKWIVTAVLMVLSLFVIIGCAPTTEATPTQKAQVQQLNESGGRLDWSQIDQILEAKSNIYGREQFQTEVNQSGLIKNQPAPMLEWSLERDNLSKRITNFNNPNKISYIYLLTNNGQVVAFFDVKGKVSSVNSSLTSSQMLVKSAGYMESPVSTVESPQMDGSYGSNGDAIFWFDSSGVYHEWNGTYFMSDQAVKLSVQPIMVEAQ